MATFWERTVHSGNHMFSLLCPFVVLVVSDLGFKGGHLILIASIPDHCYLFTFDVWFWYVDLLTCIGSISLKTLAFY